MMTFGIGRLTMYALGTINICGQQPRTRYMIIFPECILSLLGDRMRIRGGDDSRRRGRRDRGLIPPSEWNPLGPLSFIVAGVQGHRPTPCARQPLRADRAWSMVMGR